MRLVLATILSLALATSAEAASCKITGITSASLSTAVPTGPLSSTSQNAVAATLSIAFTAGHGNGSGCGIDFKISGTLTSSGGQTMSYGISTSASGSPLISYVTVPGATATVSPSTVSVPVYLIIPAGNYFTGTYADATALVEVRESGVLIASRSVVPTLQYTQTVCSIGGLSSGGTQTLDFSNGLRISTAAQIAAFGAVNCNSSATLTLSSASGAATTSANPGATHQRFFDYVATTTVNGATVTLDTSATPSFGAAESGSAAITATSTSNAALSIRVTPIAPSKPLVAGSYADVLTITITPN